MLQSGDVVELVDTLGLEPSAARCGGSTPSIPTINLNLINSLQNSSLEYTKASDRHGFTSKTGDTVIAGSLCIFFEPSKCWVFCILNKSL